MVMQCQTIHVLVKGKINYTIFHYRLNVPTINHSYFHKAIYPFHIGHILLVDNYLILSLKSTRELSNCRPIKYVHRNTANMYWFSIQISPPEDTHSRISVQTIQLVQRCKRHCLAKKWNISIANFRQYLNLKVDVIGQVGPVYLDSQPILCYYCVCYILLSFLYDIQVCWIWLNF